MSDGLDLLTSGKSPRKGPGRRMKDVRKGGGVRIVLIVLALVLIGGVVVAYLNADRIKDALVGGPEDFTGQGSGEVMVTVEAGMGGLDIAHVLEKAGVVASYEAFYELSIRDERASTIQPGAYQLKKEMSSLAALEALLERGNRIEAKVTIPEGSRVDDIVTIIAKNSDFSKPEIEAALEDPQAIGLPEAADGNPEGYLFPETYFVEPGLTAEEFLARMVAHTTKILEELDAESKAAALDLDTREILTIASILEWEVNNDEDFGKASRVVQNRLAVGEALRMDSTVHFVSGRRGDIYTTAEEREIDSPYNTYKYAGLPPGPIGSPGRAAIEAALNPPEGEWMYFVTNNETGETVFTNSYSEHQQACRDMGFSC